jgi:hypothetical protein
MTDDCFLEEGARRSGFQPSNSLLPLLPLFAPGRINGGGNSILEEGARRKGL